MPPELDQEKYSMKADKGYIMVFCFFMSGVTLIYAQSNVGAAGGRATGTGGNVSYSIGQVNFISIKNSNGLLTQGVQQPYEIYVVKGENETGIQLSISANPNPTTDFFVLTIDKGWYDNLSYRIYDGTGKLIAQQKIVNRETRISMSNLLNAVYFVKVYKSIFEVKSFKIVKIG